MVTVTKWNLQDGERQKRSIKKKNNPPDHNIVWMPLFFVLSFMQGKNELKKK